MSREVAVAPASQTEIYRVSVPHLVGKVAGKIPLTLADVARQQELAAGSAMIRQQVRRAAGCRGRQPTRRRPRGHDWGAQGRS
jgi:hypothetical protein